MENPTIQGSAVSNPPGSRIIRQQKKHLVTTPRALAEKLEARGKREEV